MLLQGSVQVADGVFRVPLSIVNAYLIASPLPGDHGWVLVDAGLSLSRSAILAAAEAAFGPNARPSAIMLTHGHFDHVGSLEALAEFWDVPVYAHAREMPYLMGRTNYPPPDPSVGGGAMAWMSPLYSCRGIDLGRRARELPADGSVPFLPGWRWIHTPGHTPGHVSFFRSADRVLVAGDAFVTTKQESLFAALFKPEVIHGPPAYFTMDWEAAHASVRELARLNPEVAATGHGVPMRGVKLQVQLNKLAAEFDRLARPARGQYVHHPARQNANGQWSVPSPAFPTAAMLLALGTGVALGVLTASRDVAVKT